MLLNTLRQGNITISDDAGAWTPGAGKRAAGLFGGCSYGLRPARPSRGGFVRSLYAQGELAERVSVVIPARNEALNLPYVLDALPAGLHEVILVDGDSVDGTIEVARRVRPDIKIIHQGRRGKGNALACGFAEVTGDIIVTLDADGSADPDEIATFVAALGSGADFAKGTRFSKGGRSHDITRLRRLGNAALNGLVNRLFGTRYTDLCYGYNAFRTFLLPVLDLPPVHSPGRRPTPCGGATGLRSRH